MKGVVLVAILSLAALPGCGGSTKHETLGSGGKHEKVKRDPVKPAAYKEFESAMRALRLGGPEAAETARARLRAAVKIDTSIWEAWFDLGTIAWKEGDDDEAVDDFSHAVQLNKGHTASLMARAEANRRAGHKKEAAGDYKSAIEKMEGGDPNRRGTAPPPRSLRRATRDS